MRTTQRSLLAATALGAAVASLALLFSPAPADAQRERTAGDPTSAASQPERLAILWTSGDPEVAHRVCLMYSHAAHKHGWFDEVRFIVWGPSARLLAADKDIQAKVASMMDDGIHVQACVVCADSYGVSEDLRAMGIEVKPMGKPLSDYIQSDWDVLSF